MTRLLTILFTCHVTVFAQLEAAEISVGEELASLGAIETSDGQRLLLQSGSVLIALKSGGDDGLAVAWTSSIPSGAYVWTHAGDRIVAIGDAGVVVAPVDGGEVRTVAPAGDVFRGGLTAAPARRPFAVGRKGAIEFVVPSLEGLAWRSQGAPDGEIATVATVAGGKDDLGWGLGYRMSARVTVPFFALTDGDADGATDLLYRAGGALRLRTAEGDRGWGRTPDSENTRMLKFEHPVPPLARDHDGDGRVDLLMVDPGEGYVFSYRGAQRPSAEPAEPDQLLKLDAWVLWRWLVDADGDDRLDLVLLTMPKVGVLGQLGVVRNRAVTGHLTVRRQRDDGSFEPSPSIKAKMELPISISVTRDRKDIRFRAPVAPYRCDGSFRYLGPDDDGVPHEHRWDGESWSKVGAGLDDVLTEEGYVASPFEPAVTDLDGDGRVEISVLVRGRSNGLDRAVMLR